MFTAGIEIDDASQRVDWGQVAKLFEGVGWSRRDPDQLERAFARSLHVRFAFADGQLVGVARAISDGEYYATLHDVIVAAAYQRRGLGRALVEGILARCAGFYFITATAAPGRDGFYERLGFRKQKTSWVLMENPDSPGSAAYIE